MTQSTHDLSARARVESTRNTTGATDLATLVEEQLRHFSIDPQTEYGRRLGALASHLYAANVAAHELWQISLRELASLEQRDRVARFNAKRFLCFQLAKILDTLQNPLRKTYQSLLDDPTQSAVKGPYPLFDNVTALFSATPVITRTATYMYACTEWVEDAFKGREPLLEIYSRLLNPTSISLANHIVDLEAGALSGSTSPGTSIRAWRRSTRRWRTSWATRTWCSRAAMSTAAPTSCCTTGTASRATSTSPCAGSTASTVEAFCAALTEAQRSAPEGWPKAATSTCSSSRRANPHGHVLDVPGICRAAHEFGLTVICDATVGTPILQPVLQRDDRSSGRTS